MARFTDDERIEKTFEIADYIINNNSSTRKAAQHFNVSNATVSVLMNDLLKKIDRERFLKVEMVLKNNKPKTVADIEVRERVIKVANLIIAGFTAEEIAKTLNVSINIINEDLQTRLLRVDEKLYKEVKLKQSSNSSKNLEKGQNMSVEDQKRDENGRFTR